MIWLGETGYQDSIKSQVKTCATTLKIDESAIFPVSAKQALLAKVRDDKALVPKKPISGRWKITLAEDIVRQRRTSILMETVTRDIGFLGE